MQEAKNCVPISQRNRDSEKQTGKVPRRIGEGKIIIIHCRGDSP